MEQAQTGRRIYSTAERQSAVEHARRVVAAGGTFADAARELSIPAKKLYRWREPDYSLAPRNARDLVPFRPVKIVPGLRQTFANDGAGPVVMGECGVRVEGLSILQIADLLRALS